MGDNRIGGSLSQHRNPSHPPYVFNAPEGRSGDNYYDYPYADDVVVGGCYCSRCFPPPNDLYCV